MRKRTAMSYWGDAETGSQRPKPLGPLQMPLVAIRGESVVVSTFPVRDLWNILILCSITVD